MKVEKGSPLGKGAEGTGRGLPQPVTSVTGFAMTGFFQGERYKAGQAGRGVRPYGGGKRCGEGRTMWASSPTESYKECGTRPDDGSRATRPTSLILYGETGGVEPRPYGSQGVRWGGPMWASSPTEGYKESGSWQASARAGATEWIVGADDSVRPVHSFFPFRGDPHKKSPLL